MIEPLESRRLLAATYYVSPNGNDAADGRSPQSAWKTIARVNGKNWNPGDAVLFEGGQTFSATGAAGANLLANPSFDAGLTAWTDTRGTAAGNSSVNPTADRNGGAALVLSGSGAAARGQDVTASVVGGQTYRLSGSTKVTSPGAGTRQFGVTFSLGGEAVATYYRGYRGTDWFTTDFAFVAPGTFDSATVWITRSGDSSTVYGDNFSLSTLPNGIVLDSTDSGTVEYPLIVGSYGTGRATINAGDGIGLWGQNISGIRVQNLKFTGTWNYVTGSGGNAGVGIEFLNTRSDNSKLEFVTVEKCETRGFQWAGVRVGGWAAKSGFRTVLITDSIAAGNGDYGFHIRGEFDRNSALYSNEKVYIARSQAFDNTGVPGRAASSGSGFHMSDTFMGTVERCVAHHNGVLGDYEGGGAFGVWAFDAAKITLQFSESYMNRTGSSRDGGGFDIDGGVTQSVVQNNYSHDNDGAGYLAGQFNGMRPWGRNIIRYNISQNDARKNAYGAITLTGPAGPYNLMVEHNTVYVTPSPGAQPTGMRLKYSGTGVNIRNNIVQTTGGLSVVDADSAAAFAQFNGNAFWSSGSPLRFRWSGVNYATLEAWRSATGREMIGTTPTGLNVDPQLAAPGTAGALNSGYKLNRLDQYRLLPTSPLIDAAVAIASAHKNYTPPVFDFFAFTLPPAARDVGAAELF
jgi:hypothetical protein